MDSSALLIVHAVATWFLTGLIWVVQVVHYPLFDRVDRDQFVAFEQAHAQRITWIVAPAMGVELVTGAWLALVTPPGIERQLLVFGLALIGLLWLSTALLQVPGHRRLAHGFDAIAHLALVRSNWLRTVTWTLRGVLVAWLVAQVG